MNSADIAWWSGLLVREYRRGHEDCVVRAVQSLVMAGPVPTLQVTVALATTAAMGTTRHPGEDFYRAEVFTDGPDGDLQPLPIDEMVPSMRCCVRLAAAGLNRDSEQIKALWEGFVDRDPTKSAELLGTALALHANSAVIETLDADAATEGGDPR